LLKYLGQTSFLIPNLLITFEKGTQTLKSANLGYQSLIFLFFFFNFNPPLEFFIKSCQNFQNTPHFFRKKKEKKLLGFRCYSKFNGIRKNPYALIFEKIYNFFFKKNKINTVVFWEF
jgi:hypothetical protein